MKNSITRHNKYPVNKNKKHKNMNRLLFLIILFTTSQICLAQKKIQNSKPIKKITPTEIKEETNVPFKLLDISPSRLVPQDVISKARNMGARLTLTYNDFKIPTSTENDFMYDSFVLYGEKEESYLVNINGNIERIPSDTRLITVTKNNSKILVDQCVSQVESSKCSNIRIIDNTGKTLDSDLSKYYYSVNMRKNLYNSENNTYVLVYSNIGSENIITENGKTFFADDVSGIQFIIPGFITYQEGGKEKLMELSTKKNIDISNYQEVYALHVNKLFVGIQNKKYVLFNPVTNTKLFESEKSINEVYPLSNINPKNYFTLGHDNLTLVDITGKKVLEDEYKRFNFSFEGNKIEVEEATIQEFKTGKKNYYNLEKKAFVYKKFYTDLYSIAELTYVRYERYYEVYNNYPNTNSSNDGFLMYDEDKKVTDLYRPSTRMTSIAKQIGDNDKIYDIYSNSTHSLIYENISGLSRIENPGAVDYFRLNKNNVGNKYSITDEEGKIVIEEIIIPDYIRFNEKKGFFELTKKRNGKAMECYDKTGAKINCE
jgi:hypothetical protein